MSFDGSLLDPHSGISTVKHPFSAASKEVVDRPISMEGLDFFCFCFRRYKLWFALMPSPVIKASRQVPLSIGPRAGAPDGVGYSLQETRIMSGI
ncbi:hypothetical protein BDN71DRAFT_1450334 [Pleurotus eryngii]|uniref:Uncharacterized protein n=1 Tax=Pleurotus eryngii TaxID=5323 RepID=A0A9P5ZVB7_PLEER|nr:hypothetical protein BDN71DRAFT_1450334 [Pleurotus eryngii]